MNKKVIIISLVLVAIVVGIIVGVVVCNNNKKAAILEDNDAQFEFVFKQYSKIVSSVILNNVTVTFDVSTYSNFITGERYSQEHIDRIKGTEIIAGDDSEKIVISIGKYNSKDKTVVITYKDSEDIHEQLFKLDVADGQIIKTN